FRSTFQWLFSKRGLSSALEVPAGPILPAGLAFSMHAGMGYVGPISISVRHMLSMSFQGKSYFSLASIIEDVLQQQAVSFSETDLASRKANEHFSSIHFLEEKKRILDDGKLILGFCNAIKRYEAARWLRRMAGVVLGKDLPAEPSDDDFRIGLRSGIILCNVLNKIIPGAISKVVEHSNDSVIIPDGSASMAFQYFENVSNFLAVVEELGIPTFEASEFEKGGNTSRIVECVLALKSYAEWKYGGGFGSWKYSANGKASNVTKPILRMNSESSLSEILSHDVYPALDPNDACNSHSISALVRSVLSGKRQDEVPTILESILNKILEEFDHRFASNNELLRETSAHVEVSDTNQSPAEEILEEKQPSSCDEMDDINKNDALPSSCDQTIQADGIGSRNVSREEQDDNVYDNDQLKSNTRKSQSLVERQKKDVEELKSDIHFTRQSIHNLQIKYQEDTDKLGEHLYRLANAASGYQKVLAENRKLYNIVQDLKGNIRVYCRVRPFLPGETKSSSVVDRIEEGTITIHTPPKLYKEGKKSFTFNKVFGPTASQVEVFADTQPLVRSVLDGYNVCIFAYGQTGSGKTFTMSGPNDLTEETYGVNYRALNDLFFLSQERKETVNIRNRSPNGINVPEANRLPVSSTDDVINLMNLGQKNRAVCATAMNDRSSRSHSCLTVHVQGRDLTSGVNLHGSMHLVDLAGSERVEKSEVTGDRLKEAVHINKSLSALGDVIAALAQKGAHIPYRNSKLTHLLQDSLEAVGETLSTLKFAERVSSVELGAAQVHKESGDVKELKEQIMNLKATLAKKEEEPDSVSSSVRFSSPESQKTKSRRDLSNGRQSPKEDKTRRRSLDPEDLSAWPPLRSHKEDEKLMSNTNEVMIKHNNVDRRRSLGTLEERTQHRLTAPYSDILKRKNEQAEEIDEFEAATSVSSDTDIQEPSKISRTSSLPVALGSKHKKPHSKPIKHQETNANKEIVHRIFSSSFSNEERKDGFVLETKNRSFKMKGNGYTIRLWATNYQRKIKAMSFIHL
ncbi:hypothetical protein V2J09_007849, partial [Rumex salicifolius]